MTNSELAVKDLLGLNRLSLCDRARLEFSFRENNIWFTVQHTSNSKFWRIFTKTLGETCWVSSLYTSLFHFRWAARESRQRDEVIEIIRAHTMCIFTGQETPLPVLFQLNSDHIHIQLFFSMNFPLSAFLGPLILYSSLYVHVVQSHFLRNFCLYAPFGVVLGHSRHF